MSEVMLTTIDNPYNPFTHFDDWLQFDHEKGYYTCEYLGRIAATSQDLSDEDNEIEIDRAIDEICEMNLLGIYRKVTKEGFDKLENQGKPIDYSKFEDENDEETDENTK